LDGSQFRNDKQAFSLAMNLRSAVKSYCNLFMPWVPNFSATMYPFSISTGEHVPLRL